MPGVHPYLMFNGNCAKAVAFYTAALDAEVISLQTFSDGPMDVAPEHGGRIMHAQLNINGALVMASDTIRGNPAVEGSNVHLSLDMDDQDLMHRYFAHLAEEGRVTMPLQKQFWGAVFGMVIDKFGIHWMLNHDTEAAGTETD